jgi:hypothetical protein
MKKSVALIVLTAMSCMTFSQSLKPQIALCSADTVFCFSLSQCRALVKEIDRRLYCDSLNVELENEIGLLKSSLVNRASCINDLLQQQVNLNKIISNQDQVIKEVNLELNQEKKKHKSQLWQKRLLAFAVVVLGVTTVVKK